jgi:hypothetical protein
MLNKPEEWKNQNSNRKRTIGGINDNNLNMVQQNN